MRIPQSLKYRGIKSDSITYRNFRKLVEYCAIPSRGLDGQQFIWLRAYVCATLSCRCLTEVDRSLLKLALSLRICQNTIDFCMNSATNRFLQRRFTKFSEITQCNDHYAVQGHSRSPILVTIESSLCDFQLVINTNLAPILHRF